MEKGMYYLLYIIMLKKFVKYKYYRYVGICKGIRC